MSSTAKKRWALLANVIKTKPEEKGNSIENKITKRSFESYNLIRSEILEQLGDHKWNRLTYSNVSVDVCYPDLRLSLDQLVGFNNTGNVCVWPSEECLAVYCVRNRHIFNNKILLEVGGGMTCLAGLLLTLSSNPLQVHLTDGNCKSVSNIKRIVDRLRSEHAEIGVEKLDTFQFLWDDKEKVESLKSSYDVIICADCLFFKESSDDLSSSLHKMLKPGGSAFIMAPNREGTFNHFKNIATKLFTNIEVHENYNSDVWKAHESWLDLPEYIPDIHYPKLMVLTKM